MFTWVLIKQTQKWKPTVEFCALRLFYKKINSQKIKARDDFYSNLCSLQTSFQANLNKKKLKRTQKVREKKKRHWSHWVTNHVRLRELTLHLHRFNYVDYLEVIEVTDGHIHVAAGTFICSLPLFKLMCLVPVRNYITAECHFYDYGRLPNFSEQYMSGQDVTWR